MEFIVKAQPTAGDVHVDTPLTNISIAYIQDQAMFIAGDVFPQVPVDKQTDLFYEYDRGFFNRNEMAKRAEGTETKGVGYAVSATPYTCPVYGLHHDISDERRANADSVFSLDRDATTLLTQQAMIHREKLWVTNFFTTGVWTDDRVGDPTPTGTQFEHWDRATSTPIEDIEADKEAILARTGFMPNTLVLGNASWRALKNHPDIVDRIKYGQTPGSPAVVSLNTVAQVFELDRIMVSRAIENTAAEGATNVHSLIAADNALLCYSAPNPGLLIPSAGYTFTWRGLFGASAFGARIRRFRMESTKSDRVEIESSFTQQVISADLGVFYSNTVE